MSYSRNFRSANKVAAVTDAATNFDEATASMPEHQKDRAAVLANVDAVLALLPDDQPVGVTINGWISTTDGVVTGVAINAQANVAQPQA